MRDLFLSLTIPAALIWALFSAQGSILVLNWIWFQRPYDFSYGAWNSLPLFKVALGIALLSNLVRGQLRPRFTPLLVIYLIFLCWITIGTFFAYDTELAWQTYWHYLPSMWIAPVLLFATIHDLKFLRMVMWVAAGGVAVNAFKVGAVLTAAGGGHVTEQISGFVGDNNGFGLVLCLVVAMLMGLRTTLPDKRWVRSLFYVFIAFVLLTIVYTQSRGAFAAMAVILFLGSILSSRPFRNIAIFMTVVLAGYIAIPAENFERLTTITNLSEDVSAEGRFENWRLAWQEALEHPLVGVGLENHIPYNTDVVQPAVQVRVAHSTYLQILGELGFPALVFYLTFIWMGFWSLVRTWRTMIPVAEKHPDLVWVRDTAFWMVCGYVGYTFGAALLNMLYIEFPWYAIFYGSMLLPLVENELSKREQTSSETAVGNEYEFNQSR